MLVSLFAHAPGRIQLCRMVPRLLGAGYPQARQPQVLSPNHHPHISRQFPHHGKKRPHRASPLDPSSQSCRPDHSLPVIWILPPSRDPQGMWTPAFHATNVAIHCVVSALLFAFCRQIGCASRPSFLASLVFAAHPVHAEAVTGIVGRSDLLCTFFVREPPSCPRVNPR